MTTQPTAYGDEYALRGYAESYETHSLSADGVGAGTAVGALNKIARVSVSGVAAGTAYGNLTNSQTVNISGDALGVGSGAATLTRVLGLRSSLERHTDTYGMDYSNVYSETYTENGVVGAGTGDAAITRIINLRGVRRAKGYSQDPYGGAYAGEYIYGSKGVGSSDVHLSRHSLHAADAFGEGLSDVHLSRVTIVEGSALGVGEAPSELRRVKLLDADALGDGTGEGFFVHVTEIEETSCGVLFKDSEVQGILVYTTESEAPLIIEQCSFVEAN